MVTGICEKTIANIVLNRERQNAFPLRWGAGNEACSHDFNALLEVLANEIKQGEYHAHRLQDPILLRCQFSLNWSTDSQYQQAGFLFLCVYESSPNDTFFTDSRERRRRGEGGRGERETLMWEKNVDRLPPVHVPMGMGPAALCHTGQGPSGFLFKAPRD